MGMSLNRNRDEETVVDIEWMELVLLARQIGLSTEEVRSFIRTDARLNLSESPSPRHTSS